MSSAGNPSSAGTVLLLAGASPLLVLSAFERPPFAGRLGSLAEAADPLSSASLSGVVALRFLLVRDLVDVVEMACEVGRLPSGLACDADQHPEADVHGDIDRVAELGDA